MLLQALLQPLMWVPPLLRMWVQPLLLMWVQPLLLMWVPPLLLMWVQMSLQALLHRLLKMLAQPSSRAETMCFHRAWKLPQRRH